jgi:hypothetical protein
MENVDDKKTIQQLCCRVVISGGSRNQKGTGYFVSPNLLVSAASIFSEYMENHSIQIFLNPERSDGQMPREGRLIAVDKDNDQSLIEILGSPVIIKLIPIKAISPIRQDRWISYGYTEARLDRFDGFDGTNLVKLSGWINRSAKSNSRAEMALSPSPESFDSAWRGLAGSPVIVQGVIIGHLRGITSSSFNEPSVHNYIATSANYIIPFLRKHTPAHLNTSKTAVSLSIANEAKVGEGIQLTRSFHATRPVLRVQDYATALAEVLRNASGEVCLALLGPWGRGKTFLARHLLENLKPQYTSIWFSAWRYRSKPELWIHLYEAFRDVYEREPWYRRIPMNFRGQLLSNGISNILFFLFSLGLAVIPAGIIFKILAYIFGIIGLLRIGSLFVKRRSDAITFFKKYFLASRHNEKLGLQAALGDDLKRMLWGWFGGPPKGMRHNLTQLASYGLLTCWLLFALWLSLHGTEPNSLKNWSLITGNLRFYPSKENLYAFLTITAAILIFSPVWLLSVGRKEANSRILLVVDDLDRMPPTEMLDIIEQLKLFLEHESLQRYMQVMMICEEDSLHAAIIQKYDLYIASTSVGIGGDGNDGITLKRKAVTEATLQKLFIAHLRLPALSLSEIEELFYAIVGEEYIHPQNFSNQTPSQGTTMEPTQRSGGLSTTTETSIFVDIPDEQIDLAKVRSQTKRPPFSEIEILELHKATMILCAPESAWYPLGPRALTSFIFRYKLARRLQLLRAPDEDPTKLATALARRLAGITVDSDQVENSQAVALVLDEVA